MMFEYFQVISEFVKGLLLSFEGNTISINKLVGLCNWKWSVHTLNNKGARTCP